MAFTSGVVSRFAPTLITADETIGTGNGSTTSFGYALLNPTVFLNTVKIKYTISAVQYTVTADSGGVFNGTGISSGSVIEAGVIALAFSTAPDYATLIFVDEYKVKGLLTKLLEFACTNKFTQNLGTGNGSTTIFSTTLSNVPVAKGQCRVKFKIGGTVYDVWDNGEGAFVHAQITSGTINYATGAISVTFALAIDNAYVMVILYTTGAEGQDWLIMLQQNAKNSTNTADAYPGTDLQEVVLKNSGPGYKEEINFGIREFQHAADNLYGWNFNQYVIWATTQEASNSWNGNSGSHGLITYDGTRNFWSTHPQTPVNNATINYRFYATKRRIVCKLQNAGTIFTSCYLGGFRAFASPSNYPKPQVVIGNTFGVVPYTNATASINCITHFPAINNFCLGLLPDNTFFLSTKVKPIPTVNYLNTGQLKKTTTNKVLLNPVFLHKYTPLPVELLGALEEVYHVPSTNLVANDILQHAGKNYRVSQNIFRTTYFDYFATLEE